MAKCWGVEWHSVNRLDGDRRFILWDEGQPLFFRTRWETRDWIRVHHGYLKERPDLRQEPHGWRMPQAVRITIDVRREER